MQAALIRYLRSSIIFMWGISLFLIVSLVVVLSSEVSYAQSATLGGIVTDSADGQPLAGATVMLRSAASSQEDTPIYGAAADADGIYLIRNVTPGTYSLTISYVGYETFRDTLVLSPGERETRSVSLARSEEQLDEVVVEARESGMARVTAGHQRITPEDIDLVPSPDISADLANYLTSLPGVVTTGDRGGQFFVRGGEPSQNLVMLDGIILYQPFHLIGFYSAFPSEIIDRVDVFAGGFGPKYAGRLSSVIDVASRAGNNRRLAGLASVSPFAGSVRIEGPVVARKLSFIGSARQSFVERTGERLYGEQLPFYFADAFGKLHLRPGPRSTISASAIHTYDRGKLVEEIGGAEAQEIRYTNDGFGLRWLGLPRILPVTTELVATHSNHSMEQGAPGETARESEVRNTRIALHASFVGDSTVTVAGWEAVFSKAHNRLGGLFQNVEASNSSLHSFGFYAEPEYRWRALRIYPGLRLQFYSVRIDPYLEPRLRVEWDVGGHHLTGAAGVYNQQLVGLNDRRDPASVFTVWAGIPRDNESDDTELLHGRLGQGVHALVGYRSRPRPWIEYSVEAFYKRLTNLFVGEWTGFPRLTTRLQPATGRTGGFEARVELKRAGFYGYVTYGYSNTLYSAIGRQIELWYATEQLDFRPGHDRRHQVNALLSTSWRGFDVNLRWSFGSGLPYTRPLAFDGFALVDDIKRAEDLEHSRRVIYERPFSAVLPTYHRLDVSLARTMHLGSAHVKLQASVINAYDRRNLFFVDVFTLKRKDQLPLLPSLGIEVAFN